MHSFALSLFFCTHRSNFCKLALLCNEYRCSECLPSISLVVRLSYFFINFFKSEAKATGLVKYQDPYPFSLDPSWCGSRSELTFLNSLKMKMSILLGVAQMNLGIILSYFNGRFFGSSLDIRHVLFTLLPSLAPTFVSALLSKEFKCGTNSSSC